MPKSIGSVSKIFLIILIIICAVGVLVIPSFGIWRDTAKSLCVVEQFSYLRSLEQTVKNAREKDAVDPEFKLKVKECIDCIWFDTEKTSLMIKIAEQDNLAAFQIDTNFRGIGCDCGDCDQESDIDGDGQPEKCANLRKDTTYVFEVTKAWVKFIGYVDSEGAIHQEGFSSHPCYDCKGYNDVCGEVEILTVPCCCDNIGCAQDTDACCWADPCPASYAYECDEIKCLGMPLCPGYSGGSEEVEILTVPCCFGLKCNARPAGLSVVNWLGRTTGASSETWSDMKCLKSTREKCNDYTECSIFTSQTGAKAQYPCHTVGDDSTNRCCSPLLSRAQTGEGSQNEPASYCTGYGGCNVYCGNVNCGYVYNSSLERFTNICCKPLGEECWYTGNTWQCCAHEMMGTPVALAQLIVIVVFHLAINAHLIQLITVVRELPV